MQNSIPHFTRIQTKSYTLDISEWLLAYVDKGGMIMGSKIKYKSN